MKKLVFYMLLSLLVCNQALYAPPIDPPTEKLGIHSTAKKQPPLGEDKTPKGSSKSPSWRDWAKIPVHFFTTLFEPFTNQDACDFYKSQGQQIKEEGLLKYGAKQIKRMGQAVKDNPLDAILLGGGVALGWTDVGETTSLVPLLGTLNGFKNGKSVLTLAKSFKSDGLVNKGLKLALCGAAVYMVASVPVAQALEFNSLTDAKAYYSGGPCPINPWYSLMNPVTECLKKGGTLQSCRPQISREVTPDLYVFTRHSSHNPRLAPVSITKLHDGQTCFYTALTSDTPVTKTCFFKLDDPATRTVKSVDMVLMKAHEGLKPGQSVQHVGLELQGDHHESKRCGYFHEITTTYDLGSKPTCLLTALESGKEVSQLCFNPDSPESLTLKKVEGISLDFKDDGKPVSIVIQDPKKFGLDVNHEEMKIEEISTHKEEGRLESELCPTASQEGVSFWGALKAWYYQQWPCDQLVSSGLDKEEL